MTRLDASTATDPGKVRSSNQDCALVTDVLVAVADGMGGHAGGEVAARTAVEVLEEAFTGQHTLRGLVAAAQEANRAIHEQSEHHRELRGMGTTLSAVAVVRERSGERLGVVNVGDSRVYLRTSQGFTQLTEDHSLVEEMVRHGELSPAEAASHPHRHILTRALGIDPGVEVDSWLLEPRLGNRLLLCSDGLTNECSDEEIRDLLDANPEPRAAARALVQAALVHGGSDNITVVVADLAPGPPPEPGGSEAVVDGRRAGAAGAAAAADGASTAERRRRRGDEGASSQASAAGAGPTGAMGALVAETAPLAAAAEGARDGRGQQAGRGRPGRRGAPEPVLVPPPGPGAHRKRHAERIVTLWSVLFVLCFLAVLGGVAGFTEWFVQSTYYVGLANGHVAVYQGRPGGLLWFKPKVVELTSTTPAQVFPPFRSELSAGMIQTSFAAAKRVAADLTNASAFLALPTAAGTTVSTTVSTPTTFYTSSTVAAPPTTAKSTTTTLAGTGATAGSSTVAATNGAVAGTSGARAGGATGASTTTSTVTTVPAASATTTAPLAGQ